MSCRLINHPLTGYEIRSKLWDQISSEVLNDSLADKLYAQTRSENFKAWFGNPFNQGESISQVINSESSEPLLVYHSSKNNFDAFDLNVSNELGFHFGTEKAAIDRSITLTNNELSTKSKRQIINASTYYYTNSLSAVYQW